MYLSYHTLYHLLFVFFFFNDPATTEIYTLSLHDALPIFNPPKTETALLVASHSCHTRAARPRDRKSTRLNSSHTVISYAVFCLKKKKKQKDNIKKGNKYHDNEQIIQQ